MPSIRRNVIRDYDGGSKRFGQMFRHDAHNGLQLQYNTGQLAQREPSQT